MDTEEIMNRIKNWFKDKTGTEMDYNRLQEMYYIINNCIEQGGTVNLICISANIHHQTQIVTNTCECKHCLQERLDIAIKNENYEHAVVLRDKIKTAKDGNNI